MLSFLKSWQELTFQKGLELSWDKTDNLVKLTECSLIEIEFVINKQQVALKLHLESSTYWSFSALGQAVQLASSLVKFPQKCLLKDRRLTYNAAYNTAYQELLKLESQDNEDILMSEAITGAKKFLSGIGRHGKSYNLKEKERKHWEDDS